MGEELVNEDFLAFLQGQNPWWVDPCRISDDSLIQNDRNAPIKWIPRLFHKIVLVEGTIHTLRGPRQVGKSTLVKLLIEKILKEVPSRDICYASCELVQTPEQLAALIKTYLRWREEPRPKGLGYLFLDEISTVANWELAIKTLADRGLFRKYCVLLTGSNALALLGGLEPLAGRRGTSPEPLDKILVPMKFAEYVLIRNPDLEYVIKNHGLHKQETRLESWQALLNGKEPPCIVDLQLFGRELAHLFNEYLVTGGIIRALQEFVQTAEISQATYDDYVRVAVGDIRRLGRNPEILQQILQQVFKCLSSAVGYQTVCQNIDVGSKNTVKSYVDLLNGIFVLSTVYRLDLKKRQAKFRSNKKIHVQDPFTFHALHDWVTHRGHAWKRSKEFLRNPEEKSKLVESVVHNHLIRFLYNCAPHDLFDPRFILWYWRDKKNCEIDFVFCPEWTDWVPIEVKYQKTISQSDLKGMTSFLGSSTATRGLIITRDKWKIESAWTRIPVHFLLMLI